MPAALASFMSSVQSSAVYGYEFPTMKWARTYLEPEPDVLFELVPFELDDVLSELVPSELDDVLFELVPSELDGVLEAAAIVVEES